MLLGEALLLARGDGLRRQVGACVGLNKLEVVGDCEDAVLLRQAVSHEQ